MKTTVNCELEICIEIRLFTINILRAHLLFYSFFSFSLVVVIRFANGWFELTWTLAMVLLNTQFVHKLKQSIEMCARTIARTFFT